MGYKGKQYIALLMILTLLLSLTGGMVTIGAEELVEDVSTVQSDVIQINDDVGGFLFFSNEQMATDAEKYNYVSFMPKNNNYTASLLENWTNKNRTTEITLDKICGDSIYMDITTTKNSLYNSTRKYSYFLIDGDFKRTVMDAEVICVMRDQSTQTTKDVTLWKSMPDGNLRLCDGSTLSGVFIQGISTNIKTAINLTNLTADFYINNELKASGVSLNKSDFVTATGFRFGIGTQEALGDLTLDNTKIVGLEQPYVLGESYRTSVFYDDTPVASWLQDKIGFHYYAQNVIKDGVKHSITLTYDNEEVYASSDALNSLLGWNCQGEQVGIKAYAAENGLNVFDDGNGMILLAEQSINFDLSQEKRWHILKEYKNGMWEAPTTVEALNDYIFFERPSKEELLADFNTNSNNVHPRIYGTKADFDRLRALKTAGTDSYFNAAVADIISKADSLVANPLDTIDYEFSGYRMFDQADTLEQRMNYLGFAYQMTDETKYAERAWKEFEVLLTFPDLNPAHIIDSGMFLAGMAVGYDWMYDAFSDVQKQKIENFAIEKGIKVLSGIYYGDFDYRNFISAKWVSNFNTIINAGLAVASLAFMEKDPALCSETLSQSLRSIEYTLKGFAPDGAWAEGPGYWQLTTRFLVDIFMALDSGLKTDYGLSKYQGLSETADFYMAVASYGGSNNFHDQVQAKQRGYRTFGYFAKRYGDYGAYASRKYEISTNPSNYTSIDTGIHPTELLCYTDNVQENSTSVSAMDAMPKGSYYQGLELVTFRDSFYETDGLYLSAHAGNVSGYHAHNDAGAFVLDHLGERWAMDLGLEDYDAVLNPEETYRKRTEGHNTLTINNHEGFNQRENTFAPVTRFEENASGGISVMDMSAIYPDVNSAVRGFYVSDNYQSVTIRDELDLNKAFEIYWFMHSKAEMTASGDEVLMTLNGKQMTAKIYVDGAGVSEHEVTIMEAEPLEGSPNPAGQSSNSGVKKIAVKVTGNGKVNITVKIAPKDSRAENVPMVLTPISQWILPEETDEDMSLSADTSASTALTNLLTQNFDTLDVSKTTHVNGVTYTPSNTDRGSFAISDGRLKLTSKLQNKDGYFLSVDSGDTQKWNSGVGTGALSMQFQLDANTNYIGLSGDMITTDAKEYLTDYDSGTKTNYGKWMITGGHQSFVKINSAGIIVFGKQHNVTVSSGVPHTFDLMIYGDNTYSLYLDGEAVAENHKIDTFSIRYYYKKAGSTSETNQVLADKTYFRGFRSIWLQHYAKIENSQCLDSTVYFDNLKIAECAWKCYLPKLVEEILEVDFTGFDGSLDSILNVYPTVNGWAANTIRTGHNFDDVTNPFNDVDRANDTALYINELATNTVGSSSFLTIFPNKFTGYQSGINGSSILSWDFAFDQYGTQINLQGEVCTEDYVSGENTYNKGKVQFKNSANIVSFSPASIVACGNTAVLSTALDTQTWHKAVMVINGDNTFSLSIDGKFIFPTGTPFDTFAVRYTGGVFTETDNGFLGFESLWFCHSAKADGMARGTYYDNILLEATYNSRYTDNALNTVQWLEAYEVMGVAVTDSDGTSYDTLTGGKSVSSISLKQNTDTPTSLVVAAALYRGNKLLDVKKKSVTLNIAQYASCDVTFDEVVSLPQDLTDCRVKVMVLNSMEELTPLAKCYTVEAKVS